MRASALVRSGNVTVTVVVVLTLLFPARTTLSLQGETVRAQPVLLQLSSHQPEAILSLIIQKASPTADVERLVRELGGTVTKNLNLIGAFAARLPAAQIPQLARAPGVRWVSLDAPVYDVEAGSRGVLREDFDIGIISTEDTGLWPGGWGWSENNWMEVGEADGPVAGEIAITSFLGGEQQGLRLQGASKGLQGAVDLSFASNPVLSLAYRRKDLVDSGQYVTLEISSDGGATWSEVDRWAGPATDEELHYATYTLAGYATSGFALRLMTAASLQGEARVYIDYLQIEYDTQFASMETVRDEALTNTIWLPAIQKRSTSGTMEATALESAAYANSRYLRDYFNSASYSNNNGTAAWASSWIEYDVAGAGPSAGNIDIYYGELWLDDNPDTGTSPSIRRKANLTGANYAALSFDFRTTSGVDPADQIAIEVSANGGTSYTRLAIIEGIYGATWDWRSYEISSFASQNTVVRFRVLSGYGSTSEYFVIDNVEIEYNTSCVQCVDTSRLANAYVQSVGATRLWNEKPYLQGQNVAVAVVDSGIAPHDDLWSDSWYPRVIASVDFTDDWYIDDANGHGTHVAGVVGGDGWASDGAYIGVAPKVNLIDVKVTDDYGRGNMSDVVAGLQWIYENKAYYNIRVVNISLNSAVQESYHASPLDAAVEILWFNGLVVVVSAGNNGNSDSGILYPPANDPFVITVGAVDDKGTASIADDKVASFSAYGITNDAVAKPDLVAPGKHIVSLLASDDSNLAKDHSENKVQTSWGNFYFKMSGTSVSAPIVAGAAALLLQDEPGLNPDQVKYRLKATANKNWPDYSSAKAGAGYVDIYAAVHGTTTVTANTGLLVSQMLLTGPEPVLWASASWNSASWNSASWNSASWNSASWNSVSWSSDDWSPSLSR